MINDTNEKKTGSVLRRASQEVRTYRSLKKIIPVAIGVIVALLVLIYVVSVLFARYGSFTVSVKDYGDREYSMSLSENDKYTNPTSRLNADAVKNVTNITASDLPNNLHDEGGEHNGENYMAYTFYVKNTSKNTLDYKYTLSIVKATSGIDAAVNIRVYYTPYYYRQSTDAFDTSTSYTDYAKAKTSGGGEREVYKDGRSPENFASSSVVTDGTIKDFKPGDITKITVVVWLEGEDEDCNDDVIGGQFKLDMVMEILGAAESSGSENN